MGYLGKGVGNKGVGGEVPTPISAAAGSGFWGWGKRATVEKVPTGHGA
jgi:hypothetical protein